MKKTPAEVLSESKKSVSKILENLGTLGAALISAGVSKDLKNFGFLSAEWQVFHNSWEEAKHQQEHLQVVQWIQQNWDANIEASKSFVRKYGPDYPASLKGTGFKVGSFILIISAYTYDDGEGDETSLMYGELFKSTDINSMIEHYKKEVGDALEVDRHQGIGDQ